MNRISVFLSALGLAGALVLGSVQPASADVTIRIGGGHGHYKGHRGHNYRGFPSHPRAFHGHKRKFHGHRHGHPRHFKRYGRYPFSNLGHGYRHEIYRPAPGGCRFIRTEAYDVHGRLIVQREKVCY